MSRRVERTVALQESIPVHIFYTTVWVDSAGQLQFREDLYGHDRRLAGALDGDLERVTERASGDCVPA
ncbi:MAG TPA: hypothetical protein VF167_07620 [Longimicrobiaceae bacterium]